MNTTDLNIGDWVYAYGDTPFKIDCIYNNGYNDVVGEYIVEYTDYETGEIATSSKDIYIQDIAPIPLTKELLKANGFINDGHSVFFPRGEELDNCYIDCGIRKNSEVRTIEIVNYSRIFKLGRAEYIYVHELQHALRLCGLDDLANNFKIK